MKAFRSAPILGLGSLLGVLCLAGCGSSEATDAGVQPASDGEGPRQVAPEEQQAEPAVLQAQGGRPPSETADGALELRDAPAEPEDAPAPTEPAADAPPDLDGWNVGKGHRDIHTVAWRLVDRDELPRNEEFELDVLVLREGAPRPGLRVALSAWMPEHDHGLVRSPLMEELGDGRYRFSGVLLHMRGIWQLRMQVFAGRDTETATFDVEL